MTPNRLPEDFPAAIARNATLPGELAKVTPPQIYSSPEFSELELDTDIVEQPFSQPILEFGGFSRQASTIRA